jgi:hypothetical protein
MHQQRQLQMATTTSNQATNDGKEVQLHNNGKLLQPHQQWHDSNGN